MTPAGGVLMLAAVLVSAPPARAAGPAAGALDAEMLRDLDAVANPSYARDRDLGRKLGLAERLRLLGGLRQVETEPPVVPAARPAGGATTPSASATVPSKEGK